MKVKLALKLAAAALASALSAASRPPNIVLILADDPGYGDLACYQNPRIKTPHLDPMETEGAKLTPFNCPMAFCAPTRASLLTGRHPFRSGMNRNPARAALGKPGERWIIYAARTV